MTAYAVGNFDPVEIGPDIVAYLQSIDATLAPFDGRFLIHGARATELEGEWRRTLVVIAFPDRERALAWYHSPAYQDILPLRTATATGAVAILDGVPDGYRAADLVRG